MVSLINISINIIWQTILDFSRSVLITSMLLMLEHGLLDHALGLGKYVITLPTIQQAVQKVDDHLLSGVYECWTVGVGGRERGREKERERVREREESREKISLQSYLCNYICSIEKIILKKKTLLN